MPRWAFCIFSLVVHRIDVKIVSLLADIPPSGCPSCRSSPCSWLSGSRCGRQKAPALKRPSTPQLPKPWTRACSPGRRPAPPKSTSTVTQVAQPHHTQAGTHRSYRFNNSALCCSFHFSHNVFSHVNVPVLYKYSDTCWLSSLQKKCLVFQIPRNIVS